MKKLLTILLTVLIALTIGGVNVFAEGDEVEANAAGDHNIAFTITPENPKKGDTLTVSAYKIDKKGDHVETPSGEIQISIGTYTTVKNTSKIAADATFDVSTELTIAGDLTIQVSGVAGNIDGVRYQTKVTVVDATKITFKEEAVGNELTYNGSAQQLIKTAAIVADDFADKCVVNYSILETKADASSDITLFKGTDAKKYVVKYQAQPLPDYASSLTASDEKTLEVTIAPYDIANATVTISGATADGLKCDYTATTPFSTLVEGVDFVVAADSDQPTRFENNGNVLTLGCNKTTNPNYTGTVSKTYSVGTIVDATVYYEGNKDYYFPGLTEVKISKEPKAGAEEAVGAAKDKYAMRAKTSKGYLVTVLGNSGTNEAPNWHVVSPYDNGDHALVKRNDIGSLDYYFALGAINDCPHDDKDTIHHESYALGTTVLKATLNVIAKPTPTPTPKKHTYVAPKTGVQ